MSSVTEQLAVSVDVAMQRCYRCYVTHEEKSTWTPNVTNVNFMLILFRTDSNETVGKLQL